MIKAVLKVDFDVRKLTKKKEIAISKGLERAMFAWENDAKILTTTEDHVVTGRYRGSINRNKSDGFSHSYSGNDADGIHVKNSYKDFEGGSNVEYALKLEKMFGIFARALDNSRQRMIDFFTETFIENL